MSVEYHGWAVVRRGPVEGTLDEGERQEIADLLAPGLRFENPRVSGRMINGEFFISVLGLTNHRDAAYDEVMRVFSAIAHAYGGSYGLLYIWDDEDEAASGRFRVWVLKRGMLVQEEDPFLSPREGIESDPGE